MPVNLRLAVATVVLLMALSDSSGAAAPPGEYRVRGMVLRVEPAARRIVVSHDRIPGLMDSMTMPFEVRDASELAPLAPGAIVEFTLVVDARTSYARDVTVRRYQSVEQDPRAVRRLGLLDRLMRGAPSTIAVGQPVPDFTLTDQTGRPVRLAALRDRVVALNFVYTRCALPQFCLRMANTFGVLQRRFAPRYGGDLALVTITFDPARDTPAVLAKYAAQWDADPRWWHFLTGSVADVKRVTATFGIEAYPDEGLLNHSVRTFVIDRQGRLAAAVDGNEFTPEQLGDLVRTVLDRE